MFGKKKEDPCVVEGMKQSFIEVSSHYDAHLNTIKVLRDTSKLMFTTASVFFTLVISLNIFFVNVKASFQLLYNILLIVLLVVFLIFLGLVIWNLMPKSLSRPFPRDYDVITKGLCVSEADRYAVLVSQYLESMKVNEPIYETIMNRLVASGVLYGVMVMIIIGLAMIPKV